MYTRHQTISTISALRQANQNRIATGTKPNQKRINVENQRSKVNQKADQKRTGSESKADQFRIDHAFAATYDFFVPLFFAFVSFREFAPSAVKSLHTLGAKLEPLSTFRLQSARLRSRTVCYGIEQRRD
jgi:hypothetical protein